MHTHNSDQTLDQPPTGTETADTGSRLAPMDTRTLAPTGETDPVVRSPEACELPSILGYQVEAEIARGGMGVVYQARDLRLNRTVAIKMILGGRYQDHDARVRFLVEAEAVASVDHPNVVGVYELGTHDGLPFFALEYVPGGTLADRLVRDGRQLPRAAAETLAKLAEGVAAAHTKGIVHRDLKPSNVLLTTAGEPKVTDFGLARVGESDLTTAGAVIGTPSYMSPEQAAGRTREVGTATDIYALGAILYELLTGRPPFLGESAIQTIQQVIAGEFERPRAAVAGVPRDLETICLKCLRREPAARYPTANALVVDLRAFLDGRPISARPVGVVERGWMWLRRYPARASAVALALAAVAGLLVGADTVRRQREAERVASDEALRETQREARAAALVEALAAAETAEVPRLLGDLASVHELVRGPLDGLRSQPVNTRAGLHGRLALLTEDATIARELAEYLPECSAGELLTLRRALAAHPEAEPALWVALRAPAPQQRARVAAALAGLAPRDPRWATEAPAVVEAVVTADTAEFVVWAVALAPVGDALLAPLKDRYAATRQRIESGDLSVSELVADAAALDRTADLLARYAADRPEQLAELLVLVDARHHRLFAPAVSAHRAAVLSALHGHLSAPPVTGSDAARDSAAKHRAAVCASLLAFGDAGPAWKLLRYPADGDPSARSYLIERLGGIEVPPVVLISRFRAETDLAARRALVIALGDYPPEAVPPAVRPGFTAELLKTYREHPDPGLHSATDWLLRRWGLERQLAAVDDELTASRPRRDGWFVGPNGHTLAIVRGPVEFDIGSPADEPGRFPNEAQCRMRIGRSYSIGTREVTIEQFKEFRPTFASSPNRGPGSAVAGVSWYDAAAYCNWLSKRANIPPDQWCYEPNKGGMYAEGMTMKPGHLALTGYRLPTEAEWEYACRAGAWTPRYYGRGLSLLHRYGWPMHPRSELIRQVGLLRPNDFGLFDMQGNAVEWVADADRPYKMAESERDDVPGPLALDQQAQRVLRGGSVFSPPLRLRSANRSSAFPGSSGNLAYGFRVARTAE